MIAVALGLLLSSSNAVAQDAPAQDVAQARFPGAPAPGSKHYDLEELYAAERFADVLKAVKTQVAATPDDPELYWHAARALFEIGERFGRDDPGIDKIAHYEEMASWAERGLAVAPNDPHLKFARGLANGRLGTTRGVLSSLFMAKGVEADWLATANSGYRYSSLDGVERLPCDAYLTLAIYYRLVPDLWVVQMLAGTRGSLDKSLDYASRADKCAPGRLGTHKELGVTQLCIATSRDDDAMLAAGKATLAEAAKYPAVDAVDAIDLKHVQKLIADPGMACGYSRDGQQELDEAKLKQ